MILKLVLKQRVVWNYIKVYGILYKSNKWENIFFFRLILRTRDSLDVSDMEMHVEYFIEPWYLVNFCFLNLHQLYGL